jgi:DNA adenine methylase
MRPIVTPLRYPGGKSRANKIIKPTFDLVTGKYKEYREPFIGGGSVALFHWTEYWSKMPIETRPPVWINDLYVPVYSFWWAVQNRVEDLVEQLLVVRSNHPTGESLKETFFKCVDVMKRYSSPSDIRTDDDKFEAAFNYFILNRCCRSGLTNVFSKEAADPKICFTSDKIKNLRTFSKIIQGWRITNLDYADLINAPGEDVFIFMDPPYLLGKLSTLYGTDGEMHDGFDHIRYRDIVMNSDHKWLITYNSCETLKEWYAKYTPKEWLLRYSMQQFKKEDGTKSTKKKIELLISNFGYGRFVYGAAKENKGYKTFFDDVGGLTTS